MKAWKAQSSAQLDSDDGDESDTMEVLNDTDMESVSRGMLANQHAVGGLFQNINNITNNERKCGDQPELMDNMDSYLSLLVHIIDNNKTNMAVKCATNLMAKIESQNRRTMDMISSKCYFYFYYIRSFELVNKLAETCTILHSRLCTATVTLRNDFEGQAVMINCLLGNYLHYNLYKQADKLVLKSTFPEQASYYYYLGRIKVYFLSLT